MAQLAYTNLSDGDKPTASGFNSRYLLPINLLNSGIEADNIASGAVNGSKIAMGSDAQGDVLYYSGSAYVRLAAGTSGQFLKTQGAGSNPTWDDVVLTHSRIGCKVKQASSTTLTVEPGILDSDGQQTISQTTLTLTTAADWAGGSSLQTTSAFAYVGVDSSGNIKMHTTAPSHSDYAVSNTNGKKRYATWSSTVYRVIGWFYMNDQGSGEIYSYEVGNIKEADVDNANTNSSGSDISLDDTTYGTDMDATLIHLYSSGNMISLDSLLSFDDGNDNGECSFLFDINGTDKTNGEQQITIAASGGTKRPASTLVWSEELAQGAYTIKVQGKVTSSTLTIRNWTISAREN